MKDVLVTIMVPAYNEEKNIARTIQTLLDQDTDIPYEIIVVDNNSKDNTLAVLATLPVRVLHETKQGSGPARQKAVDNASGTYILSADADVIYPRNWVEVMTRAIREPGVACVYSKHRFLPEPGYSASKLYILSKLRDVMVALKTVKRPWLNCYGLSMAFKRDEAREVKFIDHNTRGEDGRLAFDLQKFGRIKRAKVTVFTHVRTLKQDGTMSQVIFKRIKRELPNILTNLTTKEPHDTKTSSN
jgi:glycosyltransferase involved in cell wall biosynthesis